MFFAVPDMKDVLLMTLIVAILCWAAKPSLEITLIWFLCGVIGVSLRFQAVRSFEHKIRSIVRDEISRTNGGKPKIEDE